jgi:large subunit ribosomal protein L18
MALCVTGRHMYVQFIDDDQSHTLVSVSTLGQDAKINVAAAGAVGRRAAEAALAKGIREVVVDRGGFRFHGRIKAIVDGARAAGLTAGDAGAADAQTVEDQQ